MRFLRTLFWGGLLVAAGLYWISRNEDIDIDIEEEIDIEVTEEYEEEVSVDWADLTDFRSVDFRGGYQVVYHQDSRSYVKLVGSSEAKNRLKGRISGETLRISYRKGRQKIEKDLVIHLYAPGLEEVEVHGAVDMKGEDPLQAESLELDLSGAGKVTLSLDVGELEADISGAGQYILDGRAREADFNIAGAGDVRAFDLVAEEVSLKVAGAGNAQVHATERLEVNLMGAGKVVYEGDPKVIRPKILGAGTLKAREMQ